MVRVQPGELRKCRHAFPGSGYPPAGERAVNPTFEELQRRLGEIHDLEKAAGLLSWDEETKMPPAGADARAEHRATLNRIAHERQVLPELGELFEELRPFEEAHDYDSYEAEPHPRGAPRLREGGVRPARSAR